MKYECHVTTNYIEPGTLRHAALSRIAFAHGFRVARLFLAKGSESNLDTFMTAHSDSYSLIESRMRSVCSALNEDNFTVIRFKIEEILLDSRRGDK
jgi:hypothetical protein